jgi:hypothetical protein
LLFHGTGVTGRQERLLFCGLAGFDALTPGQFGVEFRAEQDAMLEIHSHTKKPITPPSEP